MLKGYSLHEDAVGFYSFSTDQGIKYTLFVIDYSEFWGLADDSHYKLYEFGFDCENPPTHRTYDPRIEKTIGDFIANFLIANTHCIMYVTSNKDARQHSRFKLFNRWYGKSRFSNDIEKHIRENVAMLVSKANPHRAELIELFFSA